MHHGPALSSSVFVHNLSRQSQPAVVTEAGSTLILSIGVPFSQRSQLSPPDKTPAGSPSAHESGYTTHQSDPSPFVSRHVPLTGSAPGKGLHLCLHAHPLAVVALALLQKSQAPSGL